MPASHVESYFQHILFQAGWPHFTDEEIREAFERWCAKGNYYWEQARRRRPPADEVVQGLPTLIAEDMKKRGKDLRPQKIIINPVVARKPRGEY